MVVAVPAEGLHGGRAGAGRYAVRPQSGLKLTTINVIAGLGNSAHLIAGTDGVHAATCRHCVQRLRAETRQHRENDPEDGATLRPGIRWLTPTDPGELSMLNGHGRVLAIAVMIVCSLFSVAVSSALLLGGGPVKTVAGRLVPPAPAPAVVTVAPGPDARDVDPLAQVSVTAAAGILTDVTMVNDAGKPIDGIMTPDSTSWKPAVPLGYGRTYTITAASRGTGG